MSFFITTILKRASIFLKFTPFWFFLIFFKFGAGLHYTLVSPLGERILPLWLVGLVIGGGATLQLILDVPAGHLMDRYGYLKFLKLAAVSFMLAGACLIIGITPLTYFLSIFFSTFGWLFFGPAMTAYILTQAPQASAGKFISLREVFTSLGIVFASGALPFVLLFPTSQMGYTLILLLTIALILLFFCPKDSRSVHAEIKLPTQHHYIRRHFLTTTLKAVTKLNPASFMLMLLSFSGALFYGVIWFVVPLVIAHQANSGLLSIGLGMFDFSVVVLGFLLGNLADQVNKRTLVFFGLLIFSVSGMLLGLNFGWLFLLFGFLSTTGDEMAEISLWSWLHMLDREHANDGVVAGVIAFFEDIGWALGPIVAGLLYGFVGPSKAIVIGAIPIFITWIVYQGIVRQRPWHLLRPVAVPAKPHRSRHKK